jgi:ADP-ribose pyrophosphatase YjhB (NUDIX family)
MKYCSNCGKEVAKAIPKDDDRERYICPGCETIHYQNPNIVTGTIPVWEDKILLCKRAIDPRYGLWTLPAGFMELDETTQEGAIRETLEESNARVEIQQLYTVINLPNANQVYMMFLSRLLDLDFSPGVESLKTELFTEDEIPWDELAFGTIKETLTHFFEDRKRGSFPLRFGDIVRSENSYTYKPGPGTDTD